VIEQQPHTSSRTIDESGTVGYLEYGGSSGYLVLPSQHIIYNRTGIAFNNVLKTRRGRSTFHVQKDGVSLLGGVAHGRSSAEY
jgi:hypothetical protein